MTSTRIQAFTIEGPVLDLFVSDCAECAVVFAIPGDLEQRRREDKGTFYCPNGHAMVFRGQTNEQKLKEAEAREVALKDQLQAAVHEAEQVRQALLRDRQRFANGVCPCCNRSFINVRRHMADQHPDYDITKVRQPGTVRFECSCGRRFDTLRGLRTHQGHMRPSDWAAPGAHRWRAHLTVVSSR